MTSIRELIPVLQTAIGPVILISGVGLLLLSMTNRLSRVIDRARILCAALLIILIFILALFKLDDAWLVSVVFVAGMVSLIASLGAFLTDINRSLSAFKVELFGHGHQSGLDARRAAAAASSAPET